jgi:hypothetical protein
MKCQRKLNVLPLIPFQLQRGPRADDREVSVGNYSPSTSLLALDWTPRGLAC